MVLWPEANLEKKEPSLGLLQVEGMDDSAASCGEEVE